MKFDGSSGDKVSESHCSEGTTSKSSSSGAAQTSFDIDGAVPSVLDNCSGCYSYDNHGRPGYFDTAGAAAVDADAAVPGWSRSSCPSSYPSSCRSTTTIDSGS